MDDSVNFQFWSSPVLDLSLDSFSKEIFQEFDKSIITNDSNSNITILNNQFIPKDTEATMATHTSINVITTAKPNPLNEDNEHFIAASPSSSSSVSLPEDEEETMSTTEITSPHTENEENYEDIEDNTPPTDVPASNNVSRQNSSISVASKAESHRIANVINTTSEYTPAESADIDTGVVPQQQEQQSVTNENANYKAREVMTLNPIVTKEAEASPSSKKSSFFCFNFC